MNEIHQHPDGQVYVRTDAATYEDTAANFAVDSGQSLPAMPSGADDHIYTQGVRHCFMGNGSIIEGGPMPWPLGDQLIASVSDLLAKQQTRRAAVEAARIAAIAALPPRPILIPAFTILGRLAPAEYAGIMQAAAAQLASGNGQLALWLDMARTAPGGVEIDGATTVAAKAALIAASLLTQERADAIFSAA